MIRILLLLPFAFLIVSVPLSSAASNSVVRQVIVKKDGSIIKRSVTFAQIPDHPELFVGRQLQPKSVSERWGLALFQMDWQKLEMSYIRDLVKTPVRVHGSAVIANALDPSVAYYHGEYLLAFECAGFPIGADSVCVAPLNLRDGTIDFAKMSVPVRSALSTPGQLGYTASVPKLLERNGRLYLYWSSIVYRDQDFGQGPHEPGPHGKGWVAVEARGTELVRQHDNQAPFWGIGSNGQPVRAHDPSVTREVLPRDPSDNRANIAADIFGLWSVPKGVYATAGIGGSEGEQPCVIPQAKSPGCYRLGLFFSPLPLGPFQRVSLNFPEISQEYTHIITTPFGIALLGSYHPEFPGSQTNKDLTGLILIEFELPR